MPGRETCGEMPDLRAEFTKMQEGVEFMEKQFEAMKNIFEEERLEREASRRGNESLRGMCSKHESAIVQHQGRLDQCEQYSRSPNLDTKGVVQTDGEDVTELVYVTGEVASCCQRHLGMSPCPHLRRKQG